MRGLGHEAQHVEHTRIVTPPCVRCNCTFAYAYQPWLALLCSLCFVFWKKQTYTITHAHPRIKVDIAVVVQSTQEDMGSKLTTKCGGWGTKPDTSSTHGLSRLHVFVLSRSLLRINPGLPLLLCSLCFVSCLGVRLVKISLFQYKTNGKRQQTKSTILSMALSAIDCLFKGICC